jgi:hypothetical protein
MTNVENFVDKPISEFTDKDTIYIQKIVGGFMYTFYVQFVKFEKGILSGKIIEIQPNNVHGIWIMGTFYAIGDEFSSRISKCYTFKKGRGCVWFQKDGKDWKCTS